jgi:Secretion system C-terminal sorting domain
MKTTLLITILLSIACINANAQCHYIPSTSTSPDTITYTFSGGTFASYGCAPIDPTYWLAGSENSVTITFTTPQDYPTFRVWGMNDDDSAFITVNGSTYPLNSTTASYDTKVVCGLSPGPDGVIFTDGNLIGANDNIEGNYSYQNVQLTTTNVSTITITGIGGAGWGFAGASVNCPLQTVINEWNAANLSMNIYPNPFHSFATVQFNSTVHNASLDLYNLCGKKIKTISNINGNQAILNRENLSAGIYFIRIVQNTWEMPVMKLIVGD